MVLLGIILISCDKSDEPNDNEIFVFRNIEELELKSDNRYTNPETGLDYTGWGVYEDIIFPGTSIDWSMKHEDVDGRSVLACEITGGDEYNNAFFTNTIAIAWEELDWPYTNVGRFIYSLDFYIEGTFDCDNPDNSTLEGIEFTWQHVLVPNSYGFGIQFSKGGKWRYWNDEIDQKTGQPKAWQSFFPEITGCIPTKQWNSLQLEGEIFGAGVRYTKMVLNDETFDLSSAIVGRAKVPETWVENFLQVGVQLNGNKAILPDHEEGVDPVTVYLDQFWLRGY